MPVQINYEKLTDTSKYSLSMDSRTEIIVDWIKSLGQNSQVIDDD